MKWIAESVTLCSVWDVGRRSWAWQGSSMVCPGLAPTTPAASLCVTVTVDYTTKDFKEECWRDRNSDYGKKDVILNFTLSIPTLSVTKTAVNFCTCAKRCCGVWLPTKSLFTDTGGVEGDVCERIHTKIKITAFSSYRCFCSFSSWWWHSSENGCA